MLSNETLAYESRESTKETCPYCKKAREHRTCLDPNLKAWVDICLTCEMVDYA